jgi:hypothetical protein
MSDQGEKLGRVLETGGPAMRAYKTLVDVRGGWW